MENIDFEDYRTSNIRHRTIMMNLNNDPEVARFFYDFHGYVISALTNRYLNQKTRVLVVSFDGEDVGMIFINDVMDKIELAYAILPDKRKKGYGHKMLEYFVEYVRTMYDDTEIFLSINQKNIASIKTALSVGFVKAGSIIYKYNKKGLSV